MSLSKALVMMSPALFVFTLAHADCSTFSYNRFNTQGPVIAFNGPDAVQQCEASYYTSNNECTANFECKDPGQPGQPGDPNHPGQPGQPGEPGRGGGQQPGNGGGQQPGNGGGQQPGNGGGQPGHHDAE